MSVESRRRPGATAVLVISLLATHWLLAMLSVRHKSATSDELPHLTTGVYNWKTGDYRLVPDHPPLAHMWAALPVVASSFAVPEAVGPDWWSSDVWRLGARFFYGSGNDVQGMLFRGRAMIALLSVWLALLVWWWSRRLFGDAGGLLSLVLYAFSPTMLAHARLITTDMAVTLFFPAAVGGLWWVLHRVSVRTVILSALALSGLLLSKMSGLLILPMAGVLVLVRLASGRPTVVALRGSVELRSRWNQIWVWLLVAVAHTIIAGSLIWGAYGFKYSAMRDAEAGRDRFDTPAQLSSGVEAWDYMLATLGAKGCAIAWVRDHRLLPESYLVGVAYALRHAEQRSAFLNGEIRATGWWYFFPYCFAVKTPLPLLCILLVVVAAWLGRLSRKAGSGRARSRWRSVVDAFYRTAPLWVLFGVYWAFALASNLNIGHRHILPTYPVLFILAGYGAVWSRRLGAKTGWLVPGLTVLFVAASLRMFPDYLAYFNVVAGGPANGYKHLVDSSLDWGQDLLGVKTRLEAYRRERESQGGATDPVVYLSYFGASDPSYYGIEAESLPSNPQREMPSWTPLTGGVYCISATTLQQIGVLGECRWTEALEVAYQDHRRRLQGMTARRQAGEAEGQVPGDLTGWDLVFLWQARFARLCAFLRQREPDDQVGYSVLIYRLDDQDVRRAIDGEAAELIADRPASLRWLAERTRHAKQFAAAATFYSGLLRLETGSLDPQVLDAVLAVGHSLAAQGRTGEAIRLLRAGVRRDPRHLDMNKYLAWFLATAASDDLRDGAEALQRARVAVQLSGGRDPMALDALAAACAELGRFKRAIHHADSAIALAEQTGNHALKRELMTRRDSYRAGRPYRGE